MNDDVKNNLMVNKIEVRDMKKGDVSAHVSMKNMNIYMSFGRGYDSVRTNRKMLTVNPQR